MIYKTRSGSVYQVDHEGKRVRRMSGENDPTPRQGVDGEWKSFHHINEEIAPGHLFFDWDGEGHGTITSKVVETIEEN